MLSIYTTYKLLSFKILKPCMLFHSNQVSNLSQRHVVHSSLIYRHNFWTSYPQALSHRGNEKTLTPNIGSGSGCGSRITFDFRPS